MEHRLVFNAWDVDAAMSDDDCEEGVDDREIHTSPDANSDDSDFEPDEAELEDEDGDGLDIDNDSTARENNSLLNSLFQVQDPRQGTDGRNRVLVSATALRRLFSGAASGGRGYRRNDFNQGSHYRQWFPEIKEPQVPGMELLMSGEFGQVRNKIRSRHKHLNFAKRLRDRTSQMRGTSVKEDVASTLVPNSNGTAVANYTCRVYCGQFSGDSSFYYTCGQDFRLHVYDMTSPRLPRPHELPRNWRNRDDQDQDYGHESTMKVINSIQGAPGRWTITDSHLSPDNERMIYSSLTPTVYLTSPQDPSPTQTPICFADPTPGIWGDESYFRIWSCRFSADGNEVVAGGSGKILVYDLRSDRRTVKIRAHNQDVNSCCWADTTSGNVLVSASDDTFIKVWDRRSLGASRKPSGVFVGHTEGITYVSAKGDGRYIISNGKDQALRLWDLRKMHSSSEFDNFKDDDYRSGFDYTYQSYPKPTYTAHPGDCSVMTYRGHAVLRTLIRCHFSPVVTTGQQYLYSGSADGRIHIWSLDGRIIQVLDRSKTLPISFDPSSVEPAEIQGATGIPCVRDVSWHSQEPVMMSAAGEWDSWETIRGSVVARHEWKGLSKVAGGLEDWVEKDQLERADRAHRHAQHRDTSTGRPSRWHVPGAYE